MLWLILSAMLFPYLVSKHTKSTAIRGGVIGLVLAGITGFFLPSERVRTEELKPIQVDKSLVAVSGGFDVQFTATAMDSSRHIERGTLSNVMVTVSDSPTGDVHIYRTAQKYHDNIYWMFGVCWPHNGYEIEIPQSMAANILDASNPVTVAIYKQNVTTPVAVAK